MNYYVNQSIHINLIKINAIANSSVVQIGSAGIIKPVSRIINAAETTNFEAGDLAAQIAEKGSVIPYKTVR